MTVEQQAPLTIGDLGPAEFAARLAGRGIGFQVGPFGVRFTCRIAPLAAALHRLYSAYYVLPDDCVHSFHLRLSPLTSLRKRARLVRFSVDGRTPHEDMPIAQALAVFEWGLNLVIALRTHSLLMLHAAAVERHGGVLLLPALPGHGKTTLCAALTHRGWRLLSDEFGLIEPATGVAVPIPRPMPLKNDSISVIRAFAPQAVFGPQIANTRKGTVVHVRAPDASVAQANVTARPKWSVFPRWERGARLELTTVPKVEAFAALATNAFNYEALGEAGFEAVGRLAATARTYRLVYSDLDQAVEVLESLATRDE